MAKRPNSTKLPAGGVRRPKAVAKKRLISTPRLKGVKKGLSTAELAQQFSGWLAKLKARQDAARASLEMLHADKVRERRAELDAIHDDLNVDLKVGGLPLSDAEQRQVDEFREDLKAAQEAAWRYIEHDDLSQLAQRLQREAFLALAQVRQLEQALQRPDQFPDVLKAGLDHIQDNLAARAFLTGRSRNNINFHREALMRVFQSDMPLDRHLREIVVAMFEPEERWESPWSSRQLIPKTRPHPKTKKGEKPGPRPDPFKKMYIVEFVRRRHIKQHENITAAIAAASAHFGVTAEYIFRLWGADQKIQAIIDQELELAKSSGADKDK